MTNFTKNMMIAAAAMLSAAGMTQAQTIKAEVPFGFRAAGTMMPAGSYRWQKTQTASTAVFTLTNEDSGHAIFTIPVAQNTSKAEAPPSLAFQCSGHDCTLVSVSQGDGSSYSISTPGLGKDANYRLAVIRAVLVKR